MGEHLVLYVDRLIHPPNAQAAQEAELPMPAGSCSTAVDSSVAASSSSAVKDQMNEHQNEGLGEDEPLIQVAECRICQEEDLFQNFEVPCACRGSLKYAHRKCVQHWCNEKGDITWEICHQLMALLLLRHALTVPDADGDDDTSAFFSLFLLRAAGFLLPCYIMAWAISILQQRRQRQEAAALAATQMAFVLQSGQHRGLQFTIAPRPPAAMPQETV